VRRACDLAVKKGQTAAGIFSSAQIAKRYGKFARVVCGHIAIPTRCSPSPCRKAPRQAGPRRTQRTSQTSIRNRLAARASDKPHRATDAHELATRSVYGNPGARSGAGPSGLSLLRLRGDSAARQAVLLNERMGKQLFGKNISIVDDVYHPLQLGAPYDGEGIPRGAGAAS